MPSASSSSNSNSSNSSNSNSSSSSRFVLATPRRSRRLLNKRSRANAPGAPLRPRSYNNRRARSHVCKRLFGDDDDDAVAQLNRQTDDTMLREYEDACMQVA